MIMNKDRKNIHENSKNNTDIERLTFSTISILNFSDKSKSSLFKIE